ncbi:hypothetical protein Tco_1012993 [Tanacetum coccineum]
MLDLPLVVVVVEVVVVVVVDRRAVVWRQRRTYGNTRWCSGTTLDTRISCVRGQGLCEIAAVLGGKSLATSIYQRFAFEHTDILCSFDSLI